MGKIHELSKSSASLLTSSQIITSVHCIVKELIENAFDSCSKNVEVKLEDYGLEKIEVKDSGIGIDKNDLQFVARPHFTSKITSSADLEEVSTYGFRGEALGAICAVADLVITTKSSDESVGNIVNFSHDGQVISSKPFPCAQGTTVSVQNLFKNLPVRKQYYRSEKNKKDELKKVEDILIAYGCIKNDVRFALYHNKNLIWQKPALSNTKNALIHILGKSIVDHMDYKEHTDEQTKRKIEFFLPKSGAPLNCGLSSSSRTIVSVNKRPVRMKEIDKLLKEYYNQSIHNSGKSRYPICFISFSTPLKEVDVNVEPNKTNVMLHHRDEILAQLSEMLKTFYSPQRIEDITLSHEKSSSSQALKSDSDFLNSLKNACEEKFQQAKLAFISESPVSNKNSAKNFGKNNNVICKEDVIVCTPKEPNKKKLKSSSKVSKDDIENHLNTLNSFFSRADESSDSIAGVPSVTVKRVSLNQKDLVSEIDQVGINIDSGRIGTIAVNSDLNSSSSSILGGNVMNQSSTRSNLVSEMNGVSSKFDSERISPFALDSKLCSNGKSVPAGSPTHFSLNQNNFISGMHKVGSDPENKTVVDGLRLNSNSVSRDGIANRKRHFSDSSISSVRLDEDVLKRPALDLDKQDSLISSVRLQEDVLKRPALDLDKQDSLISFVRLDEDVLKRPALDLDKQDSLISSVRLDEDVLKRPALDFDKQDSLISFVRLDEDVLKRPALDLDKQDSLISSVRLDEYVLKRPALDLDNQNGDMWSRGVHPSGGLFQFKPVRILQPKVVTSTELNSKTLPGVKEKEKDTLGKNNGSVERKLTAFDIFCRSNRLEIAAEHPELSNQQIAEILTQKWSRLSLEEKAVFRNMLDRDYQKTIKNKEKLGKKVCENLSQEQQNGVSPQKIRKRKMKTKIKDKEILYSRESVKSFNQGKKGMKSSSNNLSLINLLAPGIWVCIKEEKLFILNTFRLQESVIYHRLLETFHFECEPLDVPHIINTSHVGDEGIEVLLQLSNLEENTCGRISCEKLLANGFDIKITEGSNDDICVELLGITNSMAFYGMPDLKELLLLIKNKGFSAKLSDCRPGKIMLYLQSEANRMSRQSPAVQRIQDVEDLLKQKSYLPVDCDKCLHHKEFFTEIYKLVPP